MVTELRLTVKEAVVLEAAPAEECMEGVQALLSLDGFCVRAVDVGRALGGERTWELLLSQLLIPAYSLKGRALTVCHYVPPHASPLHAGLGQTGYSTKTFQTYCLKSETAIYLLQNIHTHIYILK